MNETEMKLAGVRDAALKLLPYRPIWVRGIKYSPRIDLDTGETYHAVEYDEFMTQNLAALVAEGPEIEGRGKPQVMVPFTGELLWSMSGKEIAEKLVEQVTEKMEAMRRNPDEHP
jgi:hypothetical protein